jgi:hypothetical protein
MLLSAGARVVYHGALCTWWVVSMFLGERLILTSLVLALYVAQSQSKRDFAPESTRFQVKPC